jgi:mono/diheme cytochrome c family protein
LRSLFVTSARSLCRALGPPLSVVHTAAGDVWRYDRDRCSGVEWRVRGGEARAVTVRTSTPLSSVCAGNYATQRTPRSVSTNSSDLFRVGERVFAVNSCEACHRLAGHGLRSPGGDLSYVGRRLSTEQLMSVLINPPSLMPSFARLGSSELAALVFFLRQQK